MEAPRHVTEALYRVHKQARLGWVGREKGSPEELNPGSFALIQLYHARDASKTYYGDLWNDRGPISGRPYDRLQRIPILLHLVSSEDVFSGKIVEIVRRWVEPIGKRMMDSARQRGKDYQSELDNMAGEMGSRMYWDAHNGGSATIPIAKKHMTEHDKAVLRGDTIQGVENTFTDNLKTGGAPLE